MSHDEYGLLEWVKDTLGRIITVNYDSSLYPISITQEWKDSNGAGSAVTRTWATFEYSNEPVEPSFDSSLAIYGPSDGDVKVLTKIIYGTSGSNLGDTRFFYNSFGQVEKVRNFAADGHELNYTATNLDTPGTGLTDVPRLSQTRTWVENFNLDSQGNEQEVVVNNSLTTGKNWTLPGGFNKTATEIEVSMTGHPHGHISRTLVGETGWEEGLPLASGDWVDVGSTSTRKRWTWNSWTQDDTSKSYILNPRVEESRVGDDENGNVLKTVLTYEMESGNISKFGLVKETTLTDLISSSVLRKVETAFEFGTTYLSRRIIGLPKQVITSGVDNSTLDEVAKVTYAYDEGDFSDSSLQQSISPTQHDDSNYGASFTNGRGNLTSTTRWNIDYPNDSNEAVTSSVKYNTAGAPVSSTDAMGRVVTFGYTDNFNDSPSDRGTFAYLTKVTDPNDQYSRSKFRFDSGDSVWADSPHPSGTGRGIETTRIYDSFGRLSRNTLENTGAYVRYEYPANQIFSIAYRTVIDTNGNGPDSSDEVLLESISDGVGRTIQSRQSHPGSSGGFAGSIAEYDVLGNLVSRSAPAEIDYTYTPSGDDASQGWLWNQWEHDWKGRVTKEINTDGSDRLFSYSGCGCAGGEVATIESELVPRDDQPTVNARRKQKVYTDVLGRRYKTELYGWNGSSIYSTTTNTFDGRDAVTQIRQYSGSDQSGTYQDVTMSYDGFGRLETRHYPIEDPNTYTEWVYNDDGSVSQKTDPRGAVTQFSYNDPRGLLTSISYDPPSGGAVPDTPNVSFTYDSLGNRLTMTDGVGNVAYTYNDLSQLVNESRYFSDLPSAPVTNNRYDISYAYNLSGELDSVTDPFGHTVEYGYDKSGRLDTVDGDATTNNPTGEYVGSIDYRAFGGIKQLDYKLLNETVQVKMQYDNRMRVSRFESTATQETSGYRLRMDYSYLADSRLAGRDDLLDDKFDRVFRHDSVGRTVFEQWGMGEDSDNNDVRVFEQTTAYDAFSEMTSVSGEHWGADIGYSESFLNGRIQGSGSPVYDAAGNIVSADQGPSQFDFGITAFDVAGRRVAVHTSAKGRLGSLLNMVTEKKYEYLFDGDGKPVAESSGVAVYHQSEQNPPDVVLTNSGYQVWSSQIGQVLTELDTDGSFIRTNIYAGDAKIGVQSSSSNSWLTSDPVTGSVATYAYTGAGSTEEITEMGEKVSLVYPDPGELGDPPANEIISYWAEMQWQCSDTAEQFWGGFANLPFHCQMSRLISSSQRPGELYGPSRSSDPNRIKGHEGLQRNVAGYLNSPSDSIMAFAMSASDKPAGKGGGQDEEGADCPYPDGSGGSLPGKVGPDGNCRYAPVSETVNVSALDFGEIPGFVETSVATIGTPSDQEFAPLPSDIRAEIVKRLDENNKRCRDFLDKVRENLRIKKTFEELLDRVFERKGDVVLANNLVGTATAGLSHYGKNGRDIGLRPSIRQETYVTSLLHELIHRAGVSRHTKFASAAFDSISASEQVTNPLPTRDDIRRRKEEYKELGISGRNAREDLASQYFSQRLNEYCAK